MGQSTQQIAEGGGQVYDPLAIPRSLAEIGGSIAVRSPLTLALSMAPEHIRKSIGDIKPEDFGTLGETLLGKEPIRPLQEQTPEASRDLKSGGYGPFSKPIAFLGTAGGPFLDLLPAGELAENAAKQLASAGTRTAVESILKESLPKLDEIAQKNSHFYTALTEGLAAAKTPAETHKILQDTSTMLKSALQANDKAKSVYTPIAERAGETYTTRGLREPVPNPNVAPPRPATPEIAAKVYDERVLKPAEQEGRAVVIGADDMKDYFGKDYDLKNHPTYSKAANDLVVDAAKRNPNPEVRMVAGGTGSGKSEIITKGISKDFNGVIYDSTLTNYEGARKLINELKAAGKTPVIYPVIRDPETAKLFTLIREAKGGHPVSDAAFARTHAKVPEVLRQLIEDGDVKINLLDVRGKKPLDYQNLQYAKDPMAVLDQMRYNEADITRLTGHITHGTELESRGGRGIAGNEKGGLPAGSRAGADKGRGLDTAGQGGRVLRDEKGGVGLPKLPALSEEARAALDVGGLGKEREAIDQLKTGRDIMRDAADTMPGRDLQKFESRATGELPEVTGKDTKESMTGSGELTKAGKFTREGDQIMHGLGFDTHEEAQKALDDYKSLRKQVKSAEKSISDRVKAFRDRKAVYDEVVRYVQAQGQARRERISAVEDFFKFNDKDMQALFKGERDVRLMSDGEFGAFMKKLEGRATERYMRNQLVNELQDTILNKELKKVDNIRRVLKLPKIENMSMGQLRDFNDFMQQFRVGDEFLSVRKLETVEHTDLNGIYTTREAQERLLAQVNKEREGLGKTPISFEDLNNIKVGSFDKSRYDTSLARQNPFYDVMVQEKNKAFLTAEMHAFEAKEEVNKLFAAARSSRSRGLVDRLIPTDGYIFKWLEATDADKIQLAENMTHEELDAAMYVRGWYSEARDYLLQQKVLKKFRTDYVTHTRRGFLEAWKEEGGYVQGMVDNTKDGPGKNFAKGLLAAVKDSFGKYVQDAAYFNILDKQTDQVLPLEKFFQYSMARTGELVPSKNVAKAFMQYLTTFEKKKALDSIIPKLDIYVHSLTPKKLTPRGLEFDSSLKRFFKEWMNTKKGRVTTTSISLMGHQLEIKPGDKLDWALRTGVALTRLIDLGASVPVGLASNFGAQLSAYRGLGEKAYMVGQGRMLTSQGRAILRKYQAMTGEPVISKMFDAQASLGDSVMNGVFGLFSFADRKARQVFLLGKMTPEEFKAGEVSADRLARLQTELGRHMPLEGSESILGKTALGKVGGQYRSWAIPLLSSTLDDISKAYRAITNAKRLDDPEKFLRSAEFGELMRTTLVSAVVGIGGYGILNDKTPAKDQTFAEKVAQKSAQDAMSLIGAADPTFWSAQPRLEKFLLDLSTSLKQIILAQKDKNGGLTGLTTLKNTVTPGVVRQLLPPTTQPKKTGTLPKLPKLPKIKIPKVNLPKLPKVRIR